MENDDTNRADVIESLAEARERFLAFVRDRVQDGEAAEDILQDALVRAAEASGRLRDADRLYAWFYAILRNAITDYHRHRQQEPVRQQLEVVDDIPDEDDADYRVVCLCFEPLIDSLKEDYADLIRTLDLEGKEPGTVAARLGITGNNLKVRRHRARQALRHRLEATCRLCAEHHCLDCTCGRPAPAGARDHGQV